MRGTNSTHRDSPITCTVAAAMPVTAIHRPSLPLASAPEQEPDRGQRALR